MYKKTNCPEDVLDMGGPMVPYVLHSKANTMKLAHYGLDDVCCLQVTIVLNSKSKLY